MTNRSHHDRLQQLFEGACQLSGVARAAWLIEQCAGDTALRNEVEQLLHLDEQPPLCPDARIGPVWVTPPNDETLPGRMQKQPMAEALKLFQRAAAIEANISGTESLAYAKILQFQSWAQDSLGNKDEASKLNDQVQAIRKAKH